MPRKILIVDDVAINRRILSAALSKDYDIMEAENGAEALAVLRRNYKILSAVILDIIMPVMDGYDVLREVRDNVAFSQIPIIVVTGTEDEEARTKALSLGANDFVMKPYNQDIIRHCLRNNIALRETASLVNAIQRDKLTGLYNREAFFEKAAAMVKERAPGHYIMSCFDVNNFKIINDQYGAVEGDRVLRFIGKAMLSDMEGIDGIGCRISADNFAALYPAEQSVSFISKLQTTAGAPAALRTSTAFSVGRYIVNDLSLSAAALYDRAYIAKRSVKGRYDGNIAYFDEAMREKLILEQQVMSDMDAALVERQFEAWFQPQYNHSTGALIGAEALVRWRHPKRGLIPPGSFIPVFEQNGFVYELDKYVWEEACAYLRKWLDEGRNPLPVSVNLSRYDIFRSDLIAVITGLIEKYELTPELLRLEITESAFATSTKQIVKIVKELIDYGFTIEIDDFGSGYSSLNTLKDVPAQVLKLDMRFLDNSENSGRGGNIVESIIRMAKWLGMSVIAEGVETIEQANYLKSIGCSYVQGYLYARPMPARDYEALCAGAGKEQRLLTMETTVDLDNNSFWDPASMDTLIFNSYVGGACIFEYCKGEMELLRVNDKYLQELSLSVPAGELYTYKLDSMTDDENLRLIRENIGRAIETGDESTCETRMDGPGSGEALYIRSTVRVIARAGERYLLYCTIINTTAEKLAERSLRETDEQLRFLNDMAHSLLAHPDTEAGMKGALNRLMEYFHGKRAYIFEFDFENRLASNTYEVCAEGISSEMEILRDVPLTHLEFLLQAFEESGYYANEDIASLDDSSAAMRESLLEEGIGSLFIIPMHCDGKLIGMLGVDDPHRELTKIERLLALGDYIAVMVTRRDLNAKIRKDGEALASLLSSQPFGEALSYTELLEKVEAIKLAELDGMTGLYNKTATEARIAAQLSRATGAPCALIIADLDNLKSINDTLGHDEGDRAILAFSAALRGQFRQTDIVGRVGGDEFVAFLDNCGTEAWLEGLMTSFMKSLALTRIGPENEFALRGSIGIAYARNGAASYETLFKRADKALYHVKRNSKNDFAFYTPEMEESFYRHKCHIAKKRDPGALSMTMREACMMMEELRLVFDIVRLVDAEQTAPYTLNDSGELVRGEHHCFAVWNRERRCEDCISLRVIAEKTRLAKREHIGGEVYQVISKYIEIDGRPFALETVAIVS